MTGADGGGRAARVPEITGVDWRGARVTRADLRDAVLREVDLSGAVIRAADVAGAEIDAPWLLDGAGLRVNGVDVAPLVEAELNLRFPGRAERYATDPDGLRAAWAALERTWAATTERVAAMPAGTADVRVDGEWSFAQTLRHLVMATDTWLRRALLGLEQPFHPIGQPDDSYVRGGGDPSVFSTSDPDYQQVLAVRAERVGMVRDLLAGVTPDDLAVPRRNPWSPEHAETTLSCLHTILEEEWEHHRFAVRDLDAIEAAARPPG